MIYSGEFTRRHVLLMFRTNFQSRSPLYAGRRALLVRVYLADFGGFEGAIALRIIIHTYTCIRRYHSPFELPII